LIAALIGFLKKPRYRGAILAFVALRCALLLTLEASEPRYTLECFPPLIALAAITCTGHRCVKAKDRVSAAAHPAPQSLHPIP